MIDLLAEQIAVIDAHGEIRFVNAAWRNFSIDGCSCGPIEWRGQNYLEVCDRAAEAGEALGRLAADGLRRLIAGEEERCVVEYPCSDQWFLMSATAAQGADDPLFVVSHHNVTQMRRAMDLARESAWKDALTGLANRGAFDDALEGQWRRCGASGLPVSLAIVDVDCFKRLNDDHGHTVGDEALRRIAETLRGFAQHPSHLAARYGGDEFAVLWGGVPGPEAERLGNDLRAALQGIVVVAHGAASVPVRASVGVATTLPDSGSDAIALINQADAEMYRIKKNAWPPFPGASPEIVRTHPRGRASASPLSGSPALEEAAAPFSPREGGPRIWRQGLAAYP